MSYHWEEEKLGAAYDSAIMRRLLTYVRPYTKLFIVCLGLIVDHHALRVDVALSHQDRDRSVYSPRAAWRALSVSRDLRGDSCGQTNRELRPSLSVAAERAKDHAATCARRSSIT
jgi:hypothetical protein